MIDAKYLFTILDTIMLCRLKLTAIIIFLFFKQKTKQINWLPSCLDRDSLVYTNRNIKKKKLKLAARNMNCIV